MGSIATILRGASPRPIRNYITKREDGIPWIKIGDVPAEGKYVTKTLDRITEDGALKSRRIFPGDFILSNSMSFGRPFISKIEGCVHDGWLIIRDFESRFLPDFLYHLLRSTKIQNEFASKVGTSSVSNLNADIVKSIEVTVPTLAEQEEIVIILDKFESLLNDISMGLPAEIRARRKQYEYYRDRLLSFGYESK